MSKHSTEYFIDLHQEVDSILKDNPGLAGVFNRAAKHPAEIAISAISGHEPSIDAAETAGELGVAQVTFVGPGAGSKKEKEHYAADLAGTLENRIIKKIGKIFTRLEGFQGKVRDKRMQQEAEKLQIELDRLQEKLKYHNFLAEAEDKLFGNFAPVWLAVLRAYAGEYQAVVGGGDCPSAEFIRALLLGTSKSLGRLSSTYILTGSTPEGMSGIITKGDDGETLSNKVLAITDPAFEPAPSPEQRAAAAHATAQAFHELFPEVVTNIAFASYATGPSGKGLSVARDREAYQAFTKNYPNSPHPAYGPIQFDAAINEEIARNKLKSFYRSLELGEISKEELDAYQLIAGLTTIISVQNLAVGNILAKAMHAVWNLSVEIGPLILPHNGIKSEKDKPLAASDLSRGEKRRSIVSTLAALSILAQSNQVR
jgi:phosphotransacetylase